MKDIKTHTYKEGQIELKLSFDKSVYINATEAYKAWGKNKTTFDSFKTRSLIPYAYKLIKSSPQFADLADLMIVRKGGNTNDQGTWLHPKLAIVFARWLSVDFEIWCDQKIEELLATGKTTATVAERSTWMDKLPALYKSMTIRKHWGPKFKSVLMDIEEYSDKLDTQKEFVRGCAKRYKGDTVKIYNRMIEYYKDLFEAGAIDRRTWEDMTNYMFIRIRQVLSAKVTRETKKVDKLVKQFITLQDKTNKILNASEYPPIPIKDIQLNTKDDIDRLTKDAYKIDGLQILYNDFLTVSTYGGQVSSTGKTRPLYVNPETKISSFGVACWPTRTGDNLFVKVSSMMKDIAFNCSIKNGVFYGVLTGSIGIRYYCMINPDTLATMIYKYTIKQI